ncbi:MAG: glycosyltransferase family 4 protein [Gemmatimonadota bacterium]
MRVVHVVTAFPRTASDPITPWLVELVRRQRMAGVDASVLAPAWRGGPAEEAFPEIPVRRFRYAPASLETLTHDETVPDRLRRRPSMLGLVPGYLLGGIRAAHEVGAQAPDVVHVHWPMPHALFGAAARRGSGGRTAVVSSFYSVELNWVRRRLRPLSPFLRWTVESADAVTAISRSTARAVREIAAVPVTVVPYGAALEDEGEAPARPALSGDGPLRLLFVGRLVERKGVEVLVRALAEVLTRRPAELTVIGAGEEEASIRRTVLACGLGGKVRLAGAVPHEELVRAYAEHDVFVLPAVVDAKGDTEGLGVVLLEALRFERPVVASDLGGIPDIVEPGRTGVLVPPGDPSALAAAIEALADRPEEARAMAGAGRRVARERFGWERVLRLTGEVYGAATERRRGA